MLNEITLFETPQLSFEIFDNRIRNDKRHEEGNIGYNAFVEKFKPKKTTDDCYTPDNIYNAVADYVANTYNVGKENFARPFYPGGDYKNYEYAKNSVVVDNPPFSILARIIEFYCNNDIKFFLFAPALTLFKNRKDICFIAVGVDITYENGANINTSFITNLESPKIKSSPVLYNSIFEENKKNEAKLHKQLPKYEYPDNVLTAAMVNQFSKYGVDFSADMPEVYFVRRLDDQKKHKKDIFGAGFLLSDKIAQAQAKAKTQAKAQAKAKTQAKAKAKAKTWQISEREKEIIRGLGKQ